MKKSIVMLCMLGIYHAKAQKINADKVPADVLNAFKKQFPQSAKPQWEMDENNYEVTFHLNKVEYSSKYNPNGTWLETEQEIKASELPAAVKQSIEKSFAKAEIEEAEKVSLPGDKTQYEVEVEQNEKQKFEVKLSAEGDILEKKEISGKKEDRD